VTGVTGMALVGAGSTGRARRARDPRRQPPTRARQRGCPGGGGSCQTAGLTQGQLAERLGVSQSQVATIERRGYEAYTLSTLHRYVQALGADFALEVRVHHVPHVEAVGTP